jgi:hypothetical protein
MIDGAAPQHGDLDLGVEQDQVDAHFGGTEGDVVLGVQVPGVAQLEDAGAAAALDVGDAEVGEPRGAEVIEPLERLGRRLEHRLDEVAPGARRGQHVGGEEALGEFHALLLGQRALALGLHLLGRRREAGHARGAVVDELLEPHRARQPVGQLVVELLGVVAQEALAGRVRGVAPVGELSGLGGFGGFGAARDALTVTQHRG